MLAFSLDDNISTMSALLVALCQPVPRQELAKATKNAVDRPGSLKSVTLFDRCVTISLVARWPDFSPPRPHRTPGVNVMDHAPRAGQERTSRVMG
jgi:hypothetical protein